MKETEKIRQHILLHPKRTAQHILNDLGMDARSLHSVRLIRWLMGIKCEKDSLYKFMREHKGSHDIGRSKDKRKRYRSPVA